MSVHLTLMVGTCLNKQPNPHPSTFPVAAAWEFAGLLIPCTISLTICRFEHLHNLRHLAMHGGFVGSWVVNKTLYRQKVTF